MVDDSLTTELERLKAENERLRRDRGRASASRSARKGACRSMASVAFP